MIKFRTELPLHSKDVKIKHKDVIFIIGSCFSSSIGQKLLQNKFNCLINPFGTLYHPLSILKNLQNLVENNPFQKGDFTQIDERFVHFDLHSDISDRNLQNLKSKITQTQRITKASISNASFAFITYGTAFYYYHREMSKIVANCHKQPGHLFDKTLASIDELVIGIRATLVTLKKLNPDIKIIFTISPVRHKRLGLIENNRSKAHLLAAVHKVIEENTDVHYFPAFELVMDDLRDYRFFKQDLVHPNQHAINYVWSYFIKTYFESETLALNKKIQTITSFLNHKPFDPESAQYKIKLGEVLAKIEILEKNNHLDFTFERDFLAKQGIQTKR